MNSALLSFVFRGDPVDSADLPSVNRIPLPSCARMEQHDNGAKEVNHRQERPTVYGAHNDPALGRRIAADVVCLKSALRKYEELLALTLQDKIGRLAGSIVPLATEVVTLEGDFNHGKGEAPRKGDGVDDLDAVELQELEHIVQFLNSLSGS